MKLYEINNRLAELIDALEPNPDGTFNMDVDEAEAEIAELLEDRENCLTWLAKLKLNTAAEAAMVKAEEQRLYALRKRLERKEQRVLDILAREIPENKDFGFAKLSYRKTTKVDISGYESCISYLQERGLTKCYSTPEPEISKTEVKKLLIDGEDVPGCCLVLDRSVSLK